MILTTAVQGQAMTDARQGVCYTSVRMQDTGRSRRLLVVGLVIAAALSYLVYSALASNTVYYQTVSELSGAAPGEYVRVAGKVAPGSIVRDGSSVRFTATDGSGRIDIAYSGVVPDIFKDNVDVVVEGRMEGGVFQAHTLLAKCPSKFESRTASDQ